MASLNASARYSHTKTYSLPANVETQDFASLLHAVFSQTNFVLLYFRALGQVFSRARVCVREAALSAFLHRLRLFAFVCVWCSLPLSAYPPMSVPVCGYGCLCLPAGAVAGTDAGVLLTCAHKLLDKVGRKRAYQPEF